MASPDVSLDELPPHLSASWFVRARGRVQEAYASYVEPNFGVSLLLLSLLFNSVMITTCKLLETDKNFDTPIHPVQILFVRMLLTYACCLLYMGVTRRVPDAPFGPKHLRLLLIARGVLGFFGVFGLYYSLQYLSVSDAVSITFLVPMVTAFLAWIFIHERYLLLEGVCGLVALGGVLLIAKPHFLFGAVADSETSSDDSVESSSSELRFVASLTGLMGVCGASSVYILLRKIGTQAHPLLSVSYFALIVCIITGIASVVVPGLAFQLPRNAYQWVLFLLIGLLGFVMQFLLAAGVQRVKASKSALMGYVGMVYALFWDLVIWGHFPSFLSIVGTGLIFSSAYVIVRYKPSDDAPEADLEQGYERAEDGSKIPVLDPDDIALQEFVITDDEDDAPELSRGLTESSSNLPQSSINVAESSRTLSARSLPGPDLVLETGANKA